MSYKLDFFDSFVCSGSACQNTCCSGWDIALDKETYDFYEASHGAFSKYVKKNIGQTDGNYFIKMTEKKRVSFLSMKVHFIWLRKERKKLFRLGRKWLNL